MLQVTLPVQLRLWWLQSPLLSSPKLHPMTDVKFLSAPCKTHCMELRKNHTAQGLLIIVLTVPLFAEIFVEVFTGERLVHSCMCHFFFSYNFFKCFSVKFYLHLLSTDKSILIFSLSLPSFSSKPWKQWRPPFQVPWQRPWKRAGWEAITQSSFTQSWPRVPGTQSWSGAPLWRASPWKGAWWEGAQR